jgi:nucleoid-associated protein YgaU
MKWFGRALFLVLILIFGAASWAFFGEDQAWLGGSDEARTANDAPVEQTASLTEPAAQHTAGAVDPTEAASNAGPTETSKSAGATPARPAFDIVRVEESGDAIIAGVAPPGWSVRVEAEGRLIGEVEAGSDGTWALLPDAPLSAGDHALSLSARAPDGSDTLSSAERVAISVSPEGAPAVVARVPAAEPSRTQPPSVATGDMVSRAEKPLTSEAEVASGRSDEPRMASADPGQSLAQEQRLRKPLGQDEVAQEAATPVNATQETATKTNAGQKLASREVAARPEAALTDAIAGEDTRPQSHLVKRGDTLWHIARAHYGSGMRYTKIFESNSDQIRDPHWIYPGQRFVLP